MPKKVTITPEVRDILTRGTWHGWLFKLPPGQLDRPLYEAVNKVLVALGGKWHRGHQGHMFGLDAKPAMIAALESGVAVDQARTMEQFFTPPEVVSRIFDRAGDVEGTDVLEPSAGAGAIALEAMRRGATVTAVEIDTRLATALCSETEGRMNIVCDDFLAWSLRLPPQVRPYDFVLMNPPFSRGQDIDHVTRAFQFLKPGGVLVSVMSPHWRFADDKRSLGLRAMAHGHTFIWEPLPAGTFRESGTDVNTGILSIWKGTHQ